MDNNHSFATHCLCLDGGGGSSNSTDVAHAAAWVKFGNRKESYYGVFTPLLAAIREGTLPFVFSHIV